MRRLKFNSAPICPPQAVAKTSVLFQPSPVTSLLFEVVDHVLPDGRVSHCHRTLNDIYLLFNQQRISRTLGIDTLNAYISSLDSSSNDSLRSLRRRMNDHQLMTFIKSRHIQSLCELKAWSSVIDDKISMEIERTKDSQDTSDSAGSSDSTGASDSAGSSDSAGASE